MIATSKVDQPIRNHKGSQMSVICKPLPAAANCRRQKTAMWCVLPRHVITSSAGGDMVDDEARADDEYADYATDR